MRYDLSGPQGNAFAIIGSVDNWCNQLKWYGYKDEIIEKMKSGDYNNLLRVVKNYFGDMVEFTSPYKIDSIDDDLYTVLEEDEYDTF